MYFCEIVNCIFLRLDGKDESEADKILEKSQKIKKFFKNTLVKKRKTVYSLTAREKVT